MAWSNSAPSGVTFGSESSKTTGSSWNHWKATVYYSYARVGSTVYFRFRIVWANGSYGDFYPYAHNSISIGGRGNTLSGDMANPSKSTYYRYYSYTNANAHSITWGLGGSSSSANSQGSYYTLATTVSVPAATKYTVSYNANGGSGAPASQTKIDKENLVLSSTKPTRTNYTFVSWNTNASGTGTTYNPGSTYTGNANLSLYAIWKENDSIIYVNNEAYKIYIDNGTSWNIYNIYIDSGSNWDRIY